MVIYIVIGINLEGWKDVLSVRVGENESAKLWTTVLNGLKNRGVEDSLFVCTDQLTDFDLEIYTILNEQAALKALDAFVVCWNENT